MSYPKWWNKTVTIYNKHENADTGEITWYRSILCGAFVKAKTVRVISGNTEHTTTEYIVRIPKSARYIPPDEWNPSDNNTTFTLQNGDILILGAVSDAIDEYTSGNRSSDLIKKYKTSGNFEIAFVSINTTMDLAHYLVRG